MTRGERGAVRGLWHGETLKQGGGVDSERRARVIFGARAASARARTMTQPTLDAGRVTLVPAVPADLDRLWEIWREPDVRRYLFDDQPVDRERARAVLEGCLGEAPNGSGLWTIREHATAPIVGCAGLMPVMWTEYDPSGAGLLEPIVALAPAVWHRGYAVESLARLVRYAFDVLDLARIAGATDVPNEASHRMLTRAGFVPQRECQGPHYRMRTYLLERPSLGRLERPHPRA